MITFFKIICLCISLISINTYSQEFYVNTLDNNVNGVLKLDVSNASQVPEPFCPPTINTSQKFTDIAIDGSNNIYYVTGLGHLYKKDAVTSNCEYLGLFNIHNNPYSNLINSLVVDSGNYIYATGPAAYELFRYDIANGIFSSMGNLSGSLNPAGDLFFYEGRLFLTTTTGITEINMPNPIASCPFMNLNLSGMFSAFSVNYGTYSKVFVIDSNYPNSTLYEVDMVNKQLSQPIRTYYNNYIQGAAKAYNLTATYSACSQTPLSTKEANTNDLYFNVINPAKNNIITKTNISRAQITQIRLFDNSGRLIKDFSDQNNVENLNISGITSGNYLLMVTTKKGETYTKKIIIKS